MRRLFRLGKKKMISRKIRRDGDVRESRKCGWTRDRRRSMDNLGTYEQYLNRLINALFRMLLRVGQYRSGEDLGIFFELQWRLRQTLVCNWLAWPRTIPFRAIWHCLYIVFYCLHCIWRIGMSIDGRCINSNCFRRKYGSDRNTDIMYSYFTSRGQHRQSASTWRTLHLPKGRDQFPRKVHGFQGCLGIDVLTLFPLSWETSFRTHLVTGDSLLSNITSMNIFNWVFFPGRLWLGYPIHLLDSNIIRPGLWVSACRVWGPQFC